MLTRLDAAMRAARDEALNEARTPVTGGKR
jgi:hypothetical protein